VLLVQACAPMIPHGPRVRAGPSGGFSAALGRGPTYSNGDDPGPFYLGAAALSGAYGWRPARASLPAVQVGVQLPWPGPISTDLYVQAPSAWLGPVAGGVGVRTEVDGRAMPYAQVGVQHSSGAGLHLVVGRYAHTRQQLMYSDEERASVGWLSAQLPMWSRLTAHLHGGLARGHVRRRYDRGGEPYVDEDRWVGMGGVTVEVHRRAR
jgi:hypothetical protein